MAVLPPGLSASVFSAAMEDFRKVVGTEWVFTSDEDVMGYRDSYSILWGEPEELVPSGAVAPSSVEQVQQIVRLANTHKIPIYPVSTGRNLSYGGSAPNMRGSVVLDLKRMKQIIAVDDTRNFCLLEPGVTYFDLYRHIQENNLKVWMDCPDPGWGSPVGNSLDRGVGYTWGQYRDHFGAHCGMEVVLPNGELIRTGMGAVSNADTWQDYKYGVGPNVDGLFAQGNFGVVTKMGFWLMPQPESYLIGTVLVPKHSDLIPLVKVTNFLEDQGLIGQPLYQSPVRGVALPQGGPPDPGLTSLMANGWPTVEAIEAYVASKGVPAYGVQLQFYGPKRSLVSNWEYAQDKMREAIPGVTFSPHRQYDIPVPEAQLDELSRRHLGIPSLEIFALVSRNEYNGPNPPDGHNNCVAVVPRTGEALMQFSKAVIEGLRAVGDNRPYTPFTTPATWHPRTFLCGPSVFTQRNDPESNARNKRLYESLVNKYAEYGWVDYRCTHAFQDLVASKFDFNNHAILRLQEQLKDTMDPNGIIAPGRYGVWPQRQRRTRA